VQVIAVYILSLRKGRTATVSAENIKAAEGDKRFYVYILFDYRGAPRYVAKGTGNRWHGHEPRADLRNVHEKQLGFSVKCPKSRFRKI
jgi:hypothetical protein